MNDLIHPTPPPTRRDWLLEQLHVFEGCAQGLRSPGVRALFAFTHSAHASWLPRQLDPVLHRLAQALGRPPIPPADQGWKAWVALAHGLLQSAGVALPEPPLWQPLRAKVDAPAAASRPQVSYVALTLPTLAPGQTAALLRWLCEVLAEFQHDASLVALGATRQMQWESLQKSLAAQAPTGTNNPHFIKAAYRLGLTWLRLTPSHFQYGWGRRGRWLKSSQTDATAALGMQIARDKVQANLLLRAAGIPVPRHVEVNSLEAALKAADQIGYPVVVKPADLDGGVGARADLQQPQAVSLAYEAARQHSRRILVEQHIAGHEYRLTVLQCRLLWAHQRVPAAVLGDGVSSIEALVQQENARRATALAQDPLAQAPIRLDADALAYLAEHGMDAGAVPAAGQSVRLQRVPAATLGGSGQAYTHSIHPDNTSLAERAVRLLRLDVAGVDLLMPDITRSWREVGGAVTEVNAIPQISNLTAPLIHDTVLCRLIDGDGRVPLLVVLGDAPTPVWVGTLTAQLDAAGLCAGVSTPEGLAIGGQWLQGPRKLAFNDLRALQLDPAVGAIVLCTNGQEFVQTGLPMDAFDVLVMAAPPGPSTSPVQVQAVQQLLRYCTRQVFVLGQGSGGPPPAALKSASQLPWTALGDQPDVLVATLVEAMLQAEATHAMALQPIDPQRQGVNP